MQLGVSTVVLQHLRFEDALDRIAALGLTAVELGAGNYPGNTHCPADELLADATRLKEYRHALDKRGLTISALACHGNPLHPNRDVAREHHRVFEQAVLLAERLDVERLTLFSGCPGDSPASNQPNWVTCAWPTDYLTTLNWQWEDVVIPYWKEQATFARNHGVRKLCFEMHPGFVVYNPATLLRLREAVGGEIGANLDPNDLFWQGIDAVVAVRTLGDATYHVHAKDVDFNSEAVRRNGVLDTTPLEKIEARSWSFRTVGHGHDSLLWKRFFGALREVGYDDVISIEHEDILASPEEGLAQAVAFLKNCLFTEPRPQPWWTS